MRIDVDRVATFWQSAVGFTVDGIIEGRYVSLSGHGVVITLQQSQSPSPQRTGCISTYS